jgi:hypothetical protein
MAHDLAEGCGLLPNTGRVPEKAPEVFLQSMGQEVKLPPGALDASPQINGQT